MQTSVGYINKSGSYTGMPEGALARNIVRSAMTAPYLERSEEHELAIRWRHDGDDRAMHKIAAAHMRLVISIASKFKRYNLPMADLVQEGYVGLLDAAARFEPSRDVRFSTYATWWIRASIQDYILRNWSIVRGGTSSAQKALFFNLRRLRAQLAAENIDMSKAAIMEAIATEVGVSIKDVETMDHRFSASDNSLSAALNEDDENSATRMDMLVDDSPLQDEIVADQIDGARRMEWLDKALRVLNERELQIIRERRLNEEGSTLEALGETMGISKERVRQIEVRAMQKLRMVLGFDFNS